MRPGVHDENIEIPLTFDLANEVHLLPRRKIVLGIFILIGIVVLALVVFFLHISWLNAIIALLILIVGTTALRLIWFDEKYYRKCYAKLLEVGSKYEQDLIWDIYDIAEIPVGNDVLAVCRYRNGVNGVFISFDKDITIGKVLENEYNHYEAISDAYQFIAQKGFSFTHIDYMDVVGKDERFDPVINELLKTPNEDLRQLLAATFEYQKFKMNRAYASYDVYCFYYSGDDILFLSELDSIITRFMEANYIRYKILDMDGIRELVKSIYNLPEFSIYKACDKVLSKSSAKRFIKVRKVEKDGVVTVISKTSKESAEDAYLREKKRNKKRSKADKDTKSDLNTQQMSVQQPPQGNMGDEQLQGYGVQGSPTNVQKSDDMFKPINQGTFTPIQSNQVMPNNANTVNQGGYSNPFMQSSGASNNGGMVNNPFEQGSAVVNPFSSSNNEVVNPFENNGTSITNPFNNTGSIQNQSVTNDANTSENNNLMLMQDSNSLMSQKDFVHETNINGMNNNEVDSDEPIDW